MSLSLKITSYQRLTPSQQASYTPDADSFTIGRNSSNDWAIPDPQRFLSGKHCRIHKEGSDYFITDTSTNGVFLNGSEDRLTRDEPVAIESGDRFRIGDYEFEVLVEDEALSGNPFTSNEETMIGDDPFDDPFSDPQPASSADSFDDSDALESDPFDDDPFADADPFAPKSSQDDDFLEEAAEPLAHMSDTPLGSSMSIDSLMGFDDDEEDEQGSEDVSQLEQRRTPLNEAFSPSSKHSAPPAPSAPEPRDQGLSEDFSDFPDNWDEATGMFVLPSHDDPFSGEGESLDEIPDDWDATTGLLKANLAPGKPAKPKPAPPPPAPPKPQPAAPQAAAPRPAPVQSATPGNAMAAFARGAGLEASQVAGIDQDILFEQVGRMLVEFTEGLIQTLGGRTHIKSEFRLDQTMIRPVENNPFKFSTSKTRTLMQLLSKNDPAYMTGVNAIKEGFDDVNAHQIAVVAGMEAALQDVLARFNPVALEKRLTNDSFIDNIIPGGKKAKYWDIFKLLFDEIAGEAEDNFQQLFGKEFARAYEEQLDRLKKSRKE